LKKENYAEMSIEELQKKRKTTQFLMGLLLGALLLSLVLNIFVNKKGFLGIAAVPLCLSPILILNYKSVKAINEELKSRGN
jgi:hypothetical protein